MSTKKKSVKKVTAKKNTPKPLFLRPKPIKVVTKKVLQSIADSIYNPKTGEFLNLCNGTLQNGPDPVCPTRPMHCGLGELYFVVTGRQPEEDRVDEGGVVREVVSRSTVYEWDKIRDKQREQAKDKIESLDLPEDVINHLLMTVDDMDYDDMKDDLDSVLNDIPTENDRGTEDDYKARAKRVAAKLREAADLLPR